MTSRVAGAVASSRTGLLSILLGVFATACGEAGSGGGPVDAGLDGSLPDVRVVDAALPDVGMGGGDAAADGTADAGPGAPACPSEPRCDPVTGAGCGPAAWCVLSDGEARCARETGTGEEGADCRRTSDCRVGLACFRLGDRNACARPCCGGAEACGFGGRCVAGAVLASGHTAAWGRCTLAISCDVLAPTRDCAPGEGCYIVDASGTTACRPAGGGGPGDACGDQEDCRPGFYCGGIGDARTCVRICALDGSDGGCPEGEGACVRASASPDGTGLCVLTSGRRRR